MSPISSRPPPVSVKSPGSSMSSARAESPSTNDRALRVQQAKQQFSERQRARLTPKEPKTPLRSTPDLFELGWPERDLGETLEGPSDAKQRAATVTFAPSEARPKSSWDA